MPLEDEKYMQRCFDLARLGAGRVSPNPMVGAVLVHGDRIIGEGYHAVFGKAHAENDIIQARFPDLQHVQSGHTTAADRDLIITV